MENEEVLEAAKKIKDFCKNCLNCKECVFITKDGCMLTTRMYLLPETWKLPNEDFC